MAVGWHGIIHPRVDRVDTERVWGQRRVRSRHSASGVGSSTYAFSLRGKNNLGHRCSLPLGENEFPILSVGSNEEFNAQLARFDEDVWNLAGQDTQLRSGEFRFTN